MKSLLRGTNPALSKGLKPLTNRCLKDHVFPEPKDLIELWEKLTPKITSEFKIMSHNLFLSGIIDQI